ncbi:MAG TPA: DNRLRE domain-containing protein [Planctomycetota bacterium]
MDPKRLETLAAAYVDGTLDEAAAAELLSLVEADPDVRRELLLHIRTDRLLRAARGVDADPVIRAIASRRANFSTRVIARIPRRPGPKPWTLLLSLVAIALLSVVAVVASRPAPTPPRPAPKEDVVKIPSPTPEPQPVPVPVPVAAPVPVPVPVPVPIPAPAPVPAPPPVPVPVPGPVPVPAPVPAPPTPTVIEAAVATLEGGRDLKAGETAAGRAAIRWPDGTRVELADGAELSELRANGGRLTRGALTATVAKQVRAFTIATPHGEAVVLGTRFTLRVDASGSFLEVHEGKVRLKRLDGMSVDVAAGLSATAAKGVPLAAKPALRTLAFQDGVSPDPTYAGTRDTSISQLKPAENRGGDAQLMLFRGSEGMETSLLRWDLSAIPPGSRIVSAEVTLFVTGALTAPGWRLHELRRPWEEREATWKSPWQIAGAQGDQDRGRPAGVVAPLVPGSITLPLSEAVVQQWAAGANFGLVFVPAGGSAKWGVESRETARPERRPRLAVTFIPPIR